MNDEPEQLPLPTFTLPSHGEVITSELTGNTYTIGDEIGEGSFGVVYGCSDVWGNELAAKVLKPRGEAYETIKNNAIEEFQKLLTLRHPCITYVYDAFEFRDTFYIITERCDDSIGAIFRIPDYSGAFWVMPIAQHLFQAVHYIHINDYVHQDIHLGNVFINSTKDVGLPDDMAKRAVGFKLGDLGITKLVHEMNPENTILAPWMLPPEYLNGDEFGVMDHRVDIYHCGLLLLQIRLGHELNLSKEDILAGKPRQMALELEPPFNFAFEKALRRHVDYRTANAMEFWRDLNTPAPEATE